MIYFIFCLYLVFITSSETTINWEWKMIFSFAILLSFLLLRIDLFNTIANIIISQNYSLHLKEKIEDCFFADFKPDFINISICLYDYFSVFILKNA